MNIIVFSAIYPAPSSFNIPNDTKVVHYFVKTWQGAGNSIQVIYLHLLPVKHLLKCFPKNPFKGRETDYVIDGINVHLLEYQLMKPGARMLNSRQVIDANNRLEIFMSGIQNPDKVFVHFPCAFVGMDIFNKFQCPIMGVLHNSDIKVIRSVRRDFKDFFFAFSTLGGRNKEICDNIRVLLERDCELVYSGIDEKLIMPHEDVIVKVNKKKSRYLIVYAGNLIPLKNVDKLILAVKEVNQDIDLEIIGDGPEKEGLLTLAKECPNIRFLGRLSREETIQRMRIADLFVMVSSPETFGLVYLEAMAQGCLTIGSKNEGIDGVLKDSENGFLVLPNNVGALVDCFNKILKMKKEDIASIAFQGYLDASAMTDFNMSMAYYEMNN